MIGSSYGAAGTCIEMNSGLIKRKETGIIRTDYRNGQVGEWPFLQPQWQHWACTPLQPQWLHGGVDLCVSVKALVSFVISGLEDEQHQLILELIKLGRYRRF
jgi:hypothetical protein